MKVTRFLASIVLLGATASVSFAQGVVSVNWTNCTGPINLSPASAPNQKMVASVLGQVLPHKAYDVRLTLGQPGGLRDAWRFDIAGCEKVAGSQLIIDVSDAKACGGAFFGLQDASANQILKFTYDPLTGKAIALCANAYNPNTVVSAGTRYLLASFKYDMTYAADGPGDGGINTCGGLDIPLCAHITNASWLTLDGTELPWAIGQEYVTSRDPNNTSGCPGATPTKGTTWGSLKSQYRN
jgi:hypothetical protein